MQLGKPIAEMNEKEQKMVKAATKGTTWILHNYRYLSMVAVPVYAFAWLLATWKMPYSFLETIILSLFLIAHVAIFQAVCQLFMLWLDAEKSLVFMSSVTSLGGAVYDYWALKQFYQTSWLKTLFIYILGFTITLIFMSIVGGTVGTFVALSEFQ